ncbi:MAG: glycosyltransferase family 61 protein, partial [Alphaproteobacteria bacterium]|nr:glycosyltransferase family 61 protein [Alphaproteobacteria bacterium]
AAQICATVTPRPRLYQPGRFGAEQPALQPAALLPRHILQLRDALAYSSGDYIYIGDASGHAPWLQGGMWGPHLALHLGLIWPKPFSVLEGEGLGHAVATLPKPTQTIEQPVAVLGYWNNYGHVLHDVLPQLEDAEAALGHDFFILAAGGLLPTVQEAFSTMGYPPERFITIPRGRSAIVRTAYCLSPRTQHQRLRLFNLGDEPSHRHYDGALDEAGLAFVKARLQQPSASAWRKLYLSRRGTSRAPENEVTLEALMTEAGFTVIQPETLSFAEQRQLFAETRMLVGLEGAGLANMLFMPPGGTVLALRSLAWGWSVNCFDELARCGGHQLTVLDFAGRFVETEELQRRLRQLS